MVHGFCLAARPTFSALPPPNNPAWKEAGRLGLLPFRACCVLFCMGFCFRLPAILDRPPSHVAFFYLHALPTLLRENTLLYGLGSLLSFHCSYAAIPYHPTPFPSSLPRGGGGVTGPILLCLPDASISVASQPRKFEEKKKFDSKLALPALLPYYILPSACMPACYLPTEEENIYILLGQFHFLLLPVCLSLYNMFSHCSSALVNVFCTCLPFLPLCCPLPACHACLCLLHLYA